ncbi:hypothetical protein GCM10026982_53970 [Nocardiopsis aegyptia]
MHTSVYVNPRGLGVRDVLVGTTGGLSGPKRGTSGGPKKAQGGRRRVLEGLEVRS